MQSLIHATANALIRSQVYRYARHAPELVILVALAALVVVGSLLKRRRS